MPTTTRYIDRMLVVAKIDATPGQDSGPTPALNAIEARNIQFTPLDVATVQNNIETPWFGNSPEFAVSAAAKMTFDVAIQGSGTAGVAPAYGPLLRAAGMAEKNLAAAHSGTAQAGGAATITLAATASAVDNAYQGMYLTLTGGPGSGAAGVILAYNGTTKVATMMDAWAVQPTNATAYSIGAQSVYAPVSQNPESATLYAYPDGVLHKLTYMRGSPKAKLSPKGIPMLTLDFLALYTTPTDVPIPVGAVYSGWKAPNPINNVWTAPAVLHGFTTNMYDFGIDLGQKTYHRDDCIGVEDILLNGREPSGSITVQAGLQAEKDWFTIARNATLGSLLFSHGTAAGSRFRVAVPSTSLKPPKPVDKNGIRAYEMGLRPVPVNGNDEIFFILD